MGQFKVYQDYATDATMVSNIFIDHYLQDANDAQIKIYLYLLRVLSSNKNCSISDLADQFNYTEKDVLRALKFWERNGLITLEFDELKNLAGVRLLDVAPKSSHVVPLAPVVPIPVKSELESVKVPEPEPKYVKPQYSTDDIIAFKSQENTSELIFVVEQYLGKPLTPSEIKTLLFFTDELGFSNDLIDYLFEYCVGKSKKDFRYIEKVAISWKEEGITTPKMAAKAAKKYDKIVYQVMNALGKTSSPTQKEADFVNKWVKEYGYDFDVIQEACNRTVLATDSHRLEYADKILGSWFASNVHHKTDIAILDNAYEKEKKRKSASQTIQTPQYKQFTQNEYDFDELERKHRCN